jgi:hypothetical protein
LEPSHISTWWSPMCRGILECKWSPLITSALVLWLGAIMKAKFSQNVGRIGLNCWRRMLWKFFGTSIFTIVFTFLGSNSFPSFEIMNLSIMPNNTIKTQFFELKLTLYSQHFSKHFYNLDKWISKIIKYCEVIQKSFINHPSIFWKFYSLLFSR